MKKKTALAIALILPVFTLGCLDSYKETFDPDMDMIVVDIWARNETEEGYKAITDHLFLYLELNITNNNEDGFIPITPHQFFAENQEGDMIWCRGMENDEAEPRLDPGGSRPIIIYFEIGSNELLVRLEYRRTVSDPISCEIPPYDLSEI